MRRRPSSVAVEIGWLAGFLALFVATMYAIEILIVPHHFNPKIAIVLAGFVAAIVTVAMRARLR
ncbi:MAG: hypothetical protein JO092_04450 [Candidatus Eremiobacteraeota bacterium]|nr:hypothetical protein [Candidatus Eremiobacteraeota bacterium]MBV8373969.1 hypothetical protein [Candidatus Eremiobacteraeota bacterium]